MTCRQSVFQLHGPQNRQENLGIMQPVNKTNTIQFASAAPLYPGAFKQSVTLAAVYPWPCPPSAMATSEDNCEQVISLGVSEVEPLSFCLRFESVKLSTQQTMPKHHPLYSVLRSQTSMQRSAPAISFLRFLFCSLTRSSSPHYLETIFPALRFCRALVWLCYHWHRSTAFASRTL